MSDGTAALTRPRVVIVVAAARNGIIGAAGKLPWRMPSDLALFRRATFGRPVIMGRKTFQSIGRPLDGRDNIVVTRNAEFRAEGVQVVGSLTAALEAGQAAARARGAGEITVIGGAPIYAEALPLADRILLTRIGCDAVGDASFPEPDPALWRLIGCEPVAANPRDQFEAELLTFERAT